jgi:HEPN domain-containing protein
MAQRLWQQSERDIVTARRLLYPDTHYAAANYAHQAAEKALKAACWYLRGEEPPWRHDLVRCADLIAERMGAVPGNVQAAVEQLQPMFDESRYPSGNVSEPIPAELIDQRDADLAIKLAEEVMAWVRTLLQRPPGRPGARTGC